MLQGTRRGADHHHQGPVIRNFTNDLHYTSVHGQTSSNNGYHHQQQRPSSGTSSSGHYRQGSNSGDDSLALEQQYDSRQAHSQFYADEFYAGDDVAVETDDEFHGGGCQHTDSHLTPPCEEDEMIEDDYLVPSLMRNGNCYLAANYNEKVHYTSAATAVNKPTSTAKKLAVLDQTPECDSRNGNNAMPMTPPSSSGSACLLFIFVEHPQDPAALDKLTLPFEDSLTVMDMMVRVAASKRFVISDYKAYQFDFDTLCYRLLKPNVTMEQLRHNCIHLFIRHSAAVVDQSTGNRDHHIHLTVKLPILSPNQYNEDDFIVYDCMSRKFWVPESISVIELLFFICDRHGLNWREWELWMWTRQKGMPPLKPGSLQATTPQMLPLKNLNKLLSFNSTEVKPLSYMNSTSRVGAAPMTILVLPKGISQRRVEEMADTLMNDPQKKVKSNKIRSFFSRLFRLGKHKKNRPKKSLSSFDVGDSRSPNYSTMPAAFRSHNDISMDYGGTSTLPMHGEGRERPTSYHESMHDSKQFETPLPRVNFHKKYRAPTPPSRPPAPPSIIKPNDRMTSSGSDHYVTASAKKRVAPKPDLVSKVSVQADLSDSTLHTASTATGSNHLEISSIHDSHQSSFLDQKSHDRVTPENSAKIIENPVYVRVGFEAVTTETREAARSVIHTVENHEYAVATSVTKTRETATVAVVTNSSQVCKPASGRQSVSSVALSSDRSVKDEGNVSAIESPSPRAVTSIYVDDTPASNSPPAELCHSSVSTSEQSASVSFVGCTEVQIKPAEVDPSGRGVIRIRSGYDVSSVAKRTKVIGGGKVKDTASRLSESLILSGLRQLQSAAMTGGSTSSMSTVGSGGGHSDSRMSTTLPYTNENVKKSFTNGSVSTSSVDRVEMKTVQSIGHSVTAQEQLSDSKIDNKAIRATPELQATKRQPKTSTPFSEGNQNGNQNGDDADDGSSDPGKTKRASLFTPRPFVPFSSSSPSTTSGVTSIGSSIPSSNGSAVVSPVSSSAMPGELVAIRDRSSNKPPVAAKGNRIYSSNSFLEQQSTMMQTAAPPPPPPLPPGQGMLRKSTGNIVLAGVSMKSELPGVSIQPPSSSSSSSNGTMESPTTSFSPSSMSSSSQSPMPTESTSGSKSRSSEPYSRTESPREQMLNAIRDSGTLARLKKVPTGDKRYVSVVKAYINGATPVAEPTHA